MEWYLLYPLIILAGVATGFINTLAGSGSVFSLLALSLAGLPINYANATNRVGILLQNSVAVYGFNKQKNLYWHFGLTLVVPIAVGALFGSFLATVVNPGDLSFIIGVFMLCILASLFFNTNRWVSGSSQEESSLSLKWWQIPIYFCIGVYGGFIQIGIGIFMLSSLVLLSGLDLLKGNAVKVLVIFCMTIVSLIIFAVTGLVRWDIGLILACGNMTGAWIATKEAAKRGAVFIRYLMIIVVIFAAAYYLGLIKMIMNVL